MPMPIAEQDLHAGVALLETVRRGKALLQSGMEACWNVAS